MPANFVRPQAQCHDGGHHRFRHQLATDALRLALQYLLRFGDRRLTLVRWWTAESASQLQRRMPLALAVAPAQDGGVAMNDLAVQITTRSGCL
ncbi:MAG TPA: hypothetical protein VIX14_01945 [Terriglobales bacterium]